MVTQIPPTDRESLKSLVVPMLNQLVDNPGMKVNLGICQLEHVQAGEIRITTLGGAVEIYRRESLPC